MDLEERDDDLDEDEREDECEEDEEDLEEYVDLDDDDEEVDLDFECLLLLSLLLWWCDLWWADLDLDLLFLILSSISSLYLDKGNGNDDDGWR